MFDFVDDMVREDRPAVKGNSNYLTPIEKATDKITRKAASGKLTESFPDETASVPVKKRPRYLAATLRETVTTIRRYNKIARRLD